MSVGSASAVVEGVIRLRGTDVRTETRDIELSRLKFYEDNPRVYSLLRANGQVPDQDEILKSLLEHEHVRVLQADIVANGGLIDPLIVRDGDFVVLEGNSRLAAYRFLATRDAIRWGTVRCTLLPKTIDEKLVFALLGQYHVKGKKDWAPFEKAGFLYRRHKTHGLELSVVAAELGIAAGDAKHLVAVYEFMIKHGDADRDRWSFYDEYLKNQKIRKVRQEHAGFDGFIVGQIKGGQIPKAMDLRDKLPTICAGPAKLLKRYIEEKVDFADAYDNAVDVGGENFALKRLRKFREWLVLPDTEGDILEPNKSVRDKMIFEIKEIEKKAKKLKDALEAVKTRMP
jgi:hypothetical protein